MTPTVTPTPHEANREILYCSHCGTPAESGSIFCKKCGGSLSPPVSLIVSPESATESGPQVHPWVRFWARVFDLEVYIIFCGILIGMYFPSTLLDKTNEAALNYLMLFSWVFVESVLLASVGTTPGKALFRIYLRLPGSKSIPFLNAFYRSLRVWWRGMGIGFPLVAIITLWHAESVLWRDGMTSWDKDGGFLVEHKKMGTLRIVFAVVFFVLFHGLILFETVSELAQTGTRP